MVICTLYVGDLSEDPRKRGKYKFGKKMLKINTKQKRDKTSQLPRS